MKVQELIKLLEKFEIENPTVIAMSCEDREKGTDIASVEYDPTNKLLSLIGMDL